MRETEEEYNCFDFLKEGKDTNFDSAMKSIDSMFNGLFKDEKKKDPVFDKLDVVDNDILKPIDKMSQQIFKTETNPNEPKYKKTKEGANFKYIGQQPEH